MDVIDDNEKERRRSERIQILNMRLVQNFDEYMDLGNDEEDDRRRKREEQLARILTKRRLLKQNGNGNGGANESDGPGAAEQQGGSQRPQSARRVKSEEPDDPEDFASAMRLMKQHVTNGNGGQPGARRGNEGDIVSGNQDGNDIAIVDPTSRNDEGPDGASMRKRRRAEYEEEDGQAAEVARLRAELQQMKSEHFRMKISRNYYKDECEKHVKRALRADPAPRVRTQNVELVEMKGPNSRDFPVNYRTPALSADGFTVSVRIKEMLSSSVANQLNPNAPHKPRVEIIPFIFVEQHFKPSYVYILVAVKQQSMDPANPTIVACNSGIYRFVDQQIGFDSGMKVLVPTDDLSRSRITIHVTMVVQQARLPDGGSDSKIVTVKGKDFFVSAAYLSQWSDYFRVYFAADMAEKRSGVYPVKDDNISAEEFEELLLVIYPTQKEVSRGNFRSLIKLAERFEMPELVRKVDLYLLNNAHAFNHAWLFRFATDKYKLPLVQAYLLQTWRDAPVLKRELMQSDEYKRLLSGTKAFVNQLFADASTRAL